MDFALKFLYILLIPTKYGGQFMKFSKKMAAVLASQALLVGMFTSCGGLGKDDFYGTWTTSYTIPTSADKDSQGGGYNSKYAGQTVDLTMFFAGNTTTSALSTCVFYQYKVRNNSNKGFWVGTYNISNNSELTSGNLELSYMYGFYWTTDNPSYTGSYTDDDGKTVKVSVTSVDDLVNYAKAADWDAFEAIVEAGNNAVITYNSKKYCADIETFAFELGEQSLFEGYKSMSATEKCWEGYCGTNASGTAIGCASDGSLSNAEDLVSTGKPTLATVSETQCSWEVKTRSFALSSDDGSSASSISDFFTDDDTSSSTSSNVITFSRVLDDIYIK